MFIGTINQSYLMDWCICNEIKVQLLSSYVHTVYALRICDSYVFCKYMNSYIHMYIDSKYVFYLCIERLHLQNEYSCVLQFHCEDTGQVLIQFQYTVICLAKLVQFPDQTGMKNMQKLHAGNQAVDTQLWHHSNPTSHHKLYPTDHKIFPRVLHY